MLLQQRWPDDPFRVLVSCVLLNQTTRRQVDGAIDALLAEFPTAEAFSEAYESEHRRAELEALIKPLGMAHVRAERLAKLGAAYADALAVADSWEDINVLELPGCGQYAADSWAIFVLGDTSVQPQDKELQKHLAGAVE